MEGRFGLAWLRRQPGVVALVLATMMAATITAWHIVAIRADDVTKLATLALRQDIARQQKVSVAPHRAESAMKGLTQQTVGVEALVDDTARSAAANGVSLTAASVNAVDASARSLGHIDLSLTLHGSYGHARAVLDDIASRHPSVLMQRLSFRRMASPTDVEAQLVLELLSPPLAADSPGAAAAGSAG